MPDSPTPETSPAPAAPDPARAELVASRLARALAAGGFVLLTLGVGLQWGPPAALIVGGSLLLVTGIGGLFR